MFNRIKRIFASPRVNGSPVVQAEPPVLAPATDAHWVALYHQLDAKFSLAQRGVNCYLFLRNPDQVAYWVRFYFDNLSLFEGRVGLHFFITHESAHIVKVLLAHPRAPVPSMLLRDPSIAPAPVSIGDAPFIRPRCKQLHDISFRDGRYIQPINRHRVNPRLKAHR